jgi:uncharacterized protein
MKITYDPAKRAQTLEDRGIDFEDARHVFAGTVLERADDRFEYGELRIITVGHLAGRMVVIVWTQRAQARHIISMRKANDREKKLFGQQFDQD